MHTMLIALATGAEVVAGPGDITTDPGPSSYGLRATTVAGAPPW